MVLFLTALLTVAGAASPSQPPAGVEGAPASAKAKPARGDRVVCKRGVNNTGSHIRPKPVCMMKREWDKQERIDSEVVRGVQNSSNLGNLPPVGDGP